MKPSCFITDTSSLPPTAATTTIVATGSATARARWRGARSQSAIAASPAGATPPIATSGSEAAPAALTMPTAATTAHVSGRIAPSREASHTTVASSSAMCHQLMPCTVPPRKLSSSAGEATNRRQTVIAAAQAPASRRVVQPMHAMPNSASA